MQKNDHILVIRLSAMGDVAMAVPIIKTLLHQYPSLKVTIASKKFTKPMWQSIDRLTFIEVDTQHQHKGLLGIYKLYQQLNSLQITAVADLHNVLRSKILRIFFKRSIPIKFIHKGRKEKKALCSLKLSKKKFLPLRTTPERYGDVFAALGFPIDFNQLQFKLKEPLPTKIKTLLTPKKPPLKLIGIAPFAAHEGKKYPLHLMQQVIIELSKQHPIILFGGGKKETTLLNNLAHNIPNVIVAAGKMSFSEELSLISNLNLMISMDSGNGHLAAMYQIPTITIWGATHPHAGFAPIGQLSNCIIANRTLFPLLPTSIYGNKKVKGYEKVMETISPNTIINHANKLLSSFC